jgi:hypothetical protein
MGFKTHKNIDLGEFKQTEVGTKEGSVDSR